MGDIMMSRDIPIDPKEGYLNGYDITFERRHYGKQTYTWVYVQFDNETTWYSLGDPWPCLTPRRVELHNAVLTVAQHVSSPDDCLTWQGK